MGFRVGKVAAQVFTPAWLVIPSFGPSLVNAALVNSRFPVANEGWVPLMLIATLLFVGGYISVKI